MNIIFKADERESERERGYEMPLEDKEDVAAVYKGVQWY